MFCYYYYEIMQRENMNYVLASIVRGIMLGRAIVTIIKTTLLLFLLFARYH